MCVEPRRWTLIVFARSGRAGEVKTRLIPLLGVDGATGLHRTLVRQTLDRAGQARGARVELWLGAGSHTGIDAGRPVDCGPAEGVFAQRGRDLGERMAHAIADAWARDGRPDQGRYVLIGCDCPAQTPQDLEQAAAALQTHELVLQPALDGGYVLIGMRRPEPRLFASIEWGSARVLRQTEDLATGLGLRVHRLRPVPDLDTEQDFATALAQGWLPR